MVRLINPHTGKEVDAPEEHVGTLVKAGFKESTPAPKKRTAKSNKK